jgi:hypothetical protein
MGAQLSASGPEQSGSGSPGAAYVPEPDIPSPLHPEAPGGRYRVQVVARGNDEVRSFLAGRGTPDEEIARLLAEAHRDGTVTVPDVPDHSGERLRLSFADNTYQLTIQGA